MPKTRVIAINGSAGAFVSINSTCVARRVEIREDEAGTAQGLTYQKPDDGFVATYTAGVPGSPDTPQIALGNPVALGGGAGPALGGPEENLANGTSAFNYKPADTYVKVKSKTVTATSVRVVEYE